MCDTGVAVLPTATFSNCPVDHVDVLFVPGGFGTNATLKDKETIDFVARAGANAKYITSVCSGSIILAAAGLLKGYRAATHWAFYSDLEKYDGVIGDHSRVCVDRNRLTGGGVTAGIDFGLTLVATLRGELAAKLSQLAMEYDPQPPFNAGSPQTAGPEVVAIFQQWVANQEKQNQSH
eukprot:TRINITY_DN24388_c0_g1_i1.p1 TRINITY_DN24388_c0_g1~~TRINITY_DN24388_c0_g1_i1.p1  ORF type:complete len:207 (+),score=44.35 TRINITY_DN24388_c0_g1_i1:90-623(+)